MRSKTGLVRWSGGNLLKTNKMDNQLNLFDGQTFDHNQDFDRLKTALDRVAWLMRDGKTRTLREIADQAKTSEAGASARLRDLRKHKWATRYGVSEVSSERASGGLWIYRVHYIR